ncbi:MAG: type II secretion system F family protein [Acidimicrobiia bacterium]
MLSVVVVVVGTFVAFELARAARRADGASRTRALAHRPGLALPPGLRTPLARALGDADLDVTPEDAVRLWVACTVGIGVVGGSLAPTLGLLGGLAVALGAPFALHLGAGRRTGSLVAALPDLLDEVAADLRAGGTVGGALDRVADGAGRLALDFVVVRSRIRLGLDLVEALNRWTADRPHPGFAEVAGALTVAATTGGRAATALTGLAASLRDRLACIVEARALSAQARASAVVVGVAPIAYLVFASVVDPGSIAMLIGTAVGRVCLVVGLTLDAVAALWMRRLLRFTT